MTQAKLSEHAYKHRSFTVNRFGLVSTALMTNTTLSLEARALYAILATYCNRERTCFPSSVTLMKITGRSRATIYRWLKELELHQVVRKTTEGRRRILLINDSDQVPLFGNGSN